MEGDQGTLGEGAAGGGRCGSRIACLLVSMTRRLVLAVALLACAPACATGLRHLTDADAVSWRSISAARLTPDGSWLVYSTVPIAGIRVNSGKAQIVARNTQSDLERRYLAGDIRDGAGGLDVSVSGRWIGFRSAASRTTTTVVAVELGTGKRMEFPDVRGFGFVVDRGEDAIVLHGHSTADNGSLGTLELRRLEDDGAKQLGAAAAFSINRQRTALAWSHPQGIELLDSASRQRRVFGGGGQCTYEQLTWSKKGGALAALRTCEGEVTEIATATRLAAGSPKTAIRRPTGMPGDFVISTAESMTRDYEQRPVLAWREDERGLFFGARPAPQGAGAAGQQPPTVVLWHARDPQLPAQKVAWSKFDTAASFLSYMSVDDGRYVRLEDDHVHVTDLQMRGRYVLAYDADVYQRPDEPNFSRDPRYPHARDYYLIDLRTGERKRVIEKLMVLLERQVVARPQLSPDGSVLLYQSEGDYFAYEAADGERRNLTAGLPTRFYFQENARNHRLVREPDAEISSPLQGWTADGRHVLISDYYDIWALPLRGGAATNLTASSRKQRLVYERATLDGLSGIDSEPREVTADLGFPMYFHVTDVDTGDTGLAQRQPGASSAEVLTWERGRARYYKARDAESYFMARTSSVESRNYHVLNGAFRPSRQLTDVNAQQREFRWPPSAQLLSYDVAEQRLHGILYLPVGSEPGRSYPTIVSIYERQSRMLHNYLAPTAAVMKWLQQGYAVLLPDIQPRVNEGGKAALQAVLAAVDVAVKTGAVDRDRLGLVGHSYGGYETCYIVTRTPLFKAAVPQAGLSDLLSHYGGIYDRYGIANGYVAEHRQPYLGGPWWANWDAFVENSPLFHARSITTPLLMAHGDNDRLVPFSQAIELFSSLRRMGKRDVVLLQYVGSDHVFVGAAATDLQDRMQQFFDHFLKGKAAPAWWSAGLSDSARIQ
jgi:dienelactone hydrolase